MPAIVTTKTLSQLQKMSDAEFANVLITMASIALPAGGLGTGFFSRLAATPIGGKVAGYATKKTGVFIASVLGAILGQAITGNNPFAREAIIGLILETTGLEIETLDTEGVKKAIGKKLSDDINTFYGTNFSPFYPTENIVPELKNQLLSEVLNAVSQSAPVNKLLSNAVAADFANQIINRYRSIHNLPAIGVGVVLPSSAERVANKAQQATFRASHERLAEWKNQSNNLIFDAFKYKLNAVRVAKKADALAFRQWQSALDIGSPTAAARQVTYNTKHAIYIAAQSVNYNGDGTTL